MNVLVTGGAGFVGSAVVDRLLNDGHSVTALCQHRRPRQQHPRLRVVSGDLFDDAVLTTAMTDAAAVVHLVGIIAEKPSRGVTFDRIHRQGTQQVIDAATRNKVRRIVYVSALGARPNAVSKYHQTKFAAEQLVRGSGLDLTIFRPSMILGPEGDFSKMVAGWAKGSRLPFFFMPYFGRGLLGQIPGGLIQPVQVTDVARAVSQSLLSPASIGELFPMAGPERFSWPDLYRRLGTSATPHPRPPIGLPAWYAKVLTRIIPPALLPFNLSQVQMSQEDNIAEMAKFESAFGWKCGGV